MPPPLNPPKIDVFNPRRLSDQQVEAVATGREDLLAEVVETIARNAAGGTVQHLALVAPRGYGKSFLLRQLRRAVEDLADQGVPVAYAHLPEELPNVSSVARLLDETRRFMVGDLSGGIGHFRDEAPDALPRALAALEQALDERFGPGRGLVVAAVENFDSLLTKFARKSARAARRRDGAGAPGTAPGTRKGDLTVELALRGILERPGNRLMLLISATRNIRNDHPGHPLFQWILERPLEPWTTREVLTYALRRRRLAQGPEARLAPREQTRLAALARFTSGAPRMIAVLVDHLLGQDLDHAAINLSALIDELTPYYKHRIDDLGDEAQEVFDALLRGGEPASQSEVAARFAEHGLPQGAIAESFRRLQAERLVEGRREAGGRRRAILYRATDRVLAYWYKQRQVIGHDPAKRGISHFEEAVELLAAWYSRDELQSEAAGFARAGRREEAAFLLHLSRHGPGPLAESDDGANGRGGPRRHRRFDFVRDLGLMLRLLATGEREAGRRFIDRLEAGVSDDLVADLDHEVRAASARWRVFLLCALSAAHLLRGADREREDERAEAAVTEAMAVAEAGKDRDFALFAQFWAVTVKVSDHANAALYLAGELDRIANTAGRAKAYAAAVAVLDALSPGPSESAGTPEAAAALIRNLTLRLTDAGLLRDLADDLEGRDATAQGAQIAALRARALQIESGGAPASVERLDPDLNRLLESTAEVGPLPTRLPQPDDPDLALWPCAVAPPGRTDFAGLRLGPADTGTIDAFAGLAPGLRISNLDEFDGNGLQTATDADRERVASLVEPMTRLENAGERAVVRMTFISAGEVYRALVQVQPDGIPEMTEDELLADDLPIASGPALGLIVPA